VRYYGFRRVAVLARAFELGSVEELANGAFMERRSAEEYLPMMEALLDRHARGRPQRFPHLDATAFRARFTYSYLLSYRHKAQALLAHNAGWLETDRAANAMIAATEEVNHELASGLALIEDWLARVIDPAQRTFPQRDLIARYGYPDVDMQQLRIDEAWG